MPYEHIDFPQPIRLGDRGLSAVGSTPQTPSSAEIMGTAEPCPFDFGARAFRPGAGDS